MKHVLFGIILLFILQTSAQPVTSWTLHLGAEVVSICNDRDGNVITAGGTGVGSQNDFDPGPATYSLDAPFFITKLDPDGNLIWAKGIKTSQIFGVATDSHNSVYFVGNLEGEGDFDPGPATYSVPYDGIPKTFICKLDADGNFKWLKLTDAYTRTCSISVMNEDIYYITRYWESWSTIRKLTIHGDSLWTKKIAMANINSTAVDHNGDACFAGYFYDTLNAGSAQLISEGAMDVFAFKLNRSGEFIWAKSIGANADDGATSVALDENSNLIIGGYCSNTVDFDPGPAQYTLASNGLFDAFVCKLSSDGSFVWAGRMGAKKDDMVRTVSSDMEGNVYSSGIFIGPTDFDPGHGIYMLDNPNGIFISKLDKNGKFMWAMSYPFNSTNNSPDITVNNCGNVYFAGSVPAFYSTPGYDIIAKIDTCSFYAGLGEPLKQSQLSVHPNPSNGNYFFDSNSYGSKETQIKIFDSFGQTAQFTIAENSLWLLNAHNGVYFLEIRNQNSVSRAKLIVSK